MSQQDTTAFDFSSDDEGSYYRHGAASTSTPRTRIDHTASIFYTPPSAILLSRESLMECTNNYSLSDPVLGRSSIIADPATPRAGHLRYLPQSDLKIYQTQIYNCYSYLRQKYDLSLL